MHFGQRLYLRTLYETDHQYSSDQDLRDLVDSYITIHEFCEHDRNAIRVIHPHSGREYSIRVEDLRESSPKFDGSDDAKNDVKISCRKNPVVFDVKRLFV